MFANAVEGERPPMKIPFAAAAFLVAFAMPFAEGYRVFYDDGLTRVVLYYDPSVTRPPSGEYKDLDTDSVFDYDAELGTLSPAGEPGRDALGYTAIDVFAYNELPSALVLDRQGICLEEFCVAALVDVVGRRPAWIELVVVPTTVCNARPPPMPSFDGSAPVTHWQPRIGVTHCGHGIAHAKLMVDGAERAIDSTPY